MTSVCEEVVRDPSDALGDLLEEYYETFTGAISFHQPYPDAPNPCLNLQRTGILGLPIATRELQTIKANTTNVGKNAAGHVWRIDALAVSFLNPAWSEFMDRMTTKACDVFGLECEAATLKCELSQLVLRTTGDDSHTSKIAWSSKTLAMLMITLPCQFSGGSIKVSQGDISAVYDLSSSSTYCTSVVAWRAPSHDNNISYKLNPVTDGHQLSLVYTLRHQSNCHARHARPGSPDLGSKIRAILKSWSGAPNKLVMLLENAYRKDTLRASELRHNDAYLLQVLDIVVGPLGFNVGLCHLRVFYCSDAYLEAHEHYGDHAKDVDEETIYMGPLVSSDGTLIKKKLRFDYSEFVSELDRDDLLEEYKRSEDDDEDDDEDGDSGVKRITKTTIIIWPESRAFFLAYDGRGLNLICDDLMHSPIPATQDSDNLISLVLGRAEEDQSLAWRTLCTVSCERKDAALWKRCVQSLSSRCLHRPDYLSGEYVLMAVKLFGWGCLATTLENYVSNIASSVDKLCFLSVLRNVLTTNLEDVEESKLIESWSATQIASALGKLDRYIPGDSDEVLLKAAKETGDGIGSVRDLIVPHLLQVADVDRLHTFAQCFQQDTDFPQTPDKAEVVITVVRAAMDKVALFEPSQFQYWSNPAAKAVKYLDRIRDLHCDELAPFILQKVQDTAMQLTDEKHRQSCIKKVMVPLLDTLETKFGSTPEYKQLQRTVIDSSLDILESIPGLSIAEDTIAAFIKTRAFTKDGLKLLLDVVWPRLEKLTLDVDALVYIAAQLNTLGSSAADPDQTARIQGMVSLAGQRYLATMTLEHKVQVEKALLVCTDTGNSDLCVEIVRRCIDPTHLEDLSYLRNVLIPMLPSIRQVGTRLGQDVSAAIRTVVTAWYLKILIPMKSRVSVIKFSGAPSQWQCDCRLCKSMKRWLFTPAGNEAVRGSGTVTETEREHLLEVLKRHVDDVVTTRVVKNGTAVRVEKRPEQNRKQSQCADWQATCALTKKILKDLGVDGDVQILLEPGLFSSISRILNYIPPAVAPVITPPHALFTSAVATLLPQDGPASKKRRIA